MWVGQIPMRNTRHRENTLSRTVLFDRKQSCFNFKSRKRSMVAGWFDSRHVIGYMPVFFFLILSMINLLRFTPLYRDLCMIIARQHSMLFLVNSCNLHFWLLSPSPPDRRNILGNQPAPKEELLKKVKEARRGADRIGGKSMANRVIQVAHEETKRTPWVAFL